MRLKKILIWSIVLLLGYFIIILFYDSRNGVREIISLNKIEIYDNDNNLIYQSNNYHDGSYIELKDISPLLIEAVIEIEDKNFYNHSGFDIYRIGKAFIKNIFNKTKIGASTITQQLIKNLYFNNKASYIRKMNEILYAIRLERIYSKEEILECYFNTLYFGNNLYGINDACHYYFGKDPIEINENEIALIIALIRSPSKYDPIIYYEKAMERKNTILKILMKKSIITKDKYNYFINHNINILKGKVSNYDNSVLFFKDIIISEYKKLVIKKEFNQVYRIYTAYDSTLNNSLNNYMLNNKTSSDIALIAVNQDGYYMSNIGGYDYYSSSYNSGMAGNRDIGSTIKPLLYYEGLKHGMNPLSQFVSKKTTFFINKEPYPISNFNDIYENKKITMGYALATSDNIYAVKTHLALGMNTLVEALNKFDIKANKSINLALGNVSMSLDKLVQIFHTFSKLGYYQSFKGIIKITNSKKLIYQPKQASKRLLNSKETFIINSLMTNMFDNNLNSKIKVTGSSIANDINYTLAGKSGLTDYDAYMIGFNPLYTIGVWSGYKDNRLLTNLNDKGIPKKLFKVGFNSVMNNKEDIWYKCPSEVKYMFTDPTLFNTGYKKWVYY